MQNNNDKVGGLQSGSKIYDNICRVRTEARDIKCD